MGFKRETELLGSLQPCPSATFGLRRSASGCLRRAEPVSVLLTWQCNQEFYFILGLFIFFAETGLAPGFNGEGNSFGNWCPALAKRARRPVASARENGRSGLPLIRLPGRGWATRVSRVGAWGRGRDAVAATSAERFLLFIYLLLCNRARLTLQALDASCGPPPPLPAWLHGAGGLPALAREPRCPGAARICKGSSRGADVNIPQ